MNIEIEIQIHPDHEDCCHPTCLGFQRGTCCIFRQYGLGLSSDDMIPRGLKKRLIEGNMYYKRCHKCLLSSK